MLDRYKLSTAGLKKALIARLAASGQYTLAGPDYDRWTVTALKAAARKAGISASVTRSLVIDKLRQANEQKQPAAPAVQSAPSPKRRVRYRVNQLISRSPPVRRAAARRHQRPRRLEPPRPRSGATLPARRLRAAIRHLRRSLYHPAGASSTSPAVPSPRGYACTYHCAIHEVMRSENCQAISQNCHIWSLLTHHSPPRKPRLSLARPRRRRSLWRRRRPRRRLSALARPRSRRSGACRRLSRRR